MIFGLIFDLSGSALYFGLSPLIYSTTGYLSGNLKGLYSKINPLFFPKNVTLGRKNMIPDGKNVKILTF